MLSKRTFDLRKAVRNAPTTAEAYRISLLWRESQAKDRAKTQRTICEILEAAKWLVQEFWKPVLCGIGFIAFPIIGCIFCEKIAEFLLNLV